MSRYQEGSMRNDLEDIRSNILRLLFKAERGAISLSASIIGKLIDDLGTINRLLDKR
jgi:hypothetical protein